MSSRPSWMIIALILFIAFDVAATVLIFVLIRRKNRYRGFEVITKPESEELPEARKE